jgi:hypothetical protein
MTTRTLVGVLVLLATTATAARAQFAVIDAANLTQTMLIAERMRQHYQELRRQVTTIQRMARGLGDMDRYRVPKVALTAPDPSRWEYGRQWIEAMNSGDARGAAYLSAVLPLLESSARPTSLTAAARQTLERQYATVEIADSVAMAAAHQIGLSREYHGRLQRAVQALEDDVLSPDSRYHEMTTILDKIAAGELLGRRQDMAANQLLSHALEQLLARSKRQRDTEAATLNMQLTTWRDGEAANRAFVAGSGDALRTWRQP